MLQAAHQAPGYDLVIILNDFDRAPTNRALPGSEHYLEIIQGLPKQLSS